MSENQVTVVIDVMINTGDYSHTKLGVVHSGTYQPGEDAILCHQRVSGEARQMILADIMSVTTGQSAYIRRKALAQIGVGDPEPLPEAHEGSYDDPGDEDDYDSDDDEGDDDGEPDYDDLDDPPPGDSDEDTRKLGDLPPDDPQEMPLVFDPDPQEYSEGTRGAFNEHDADLRAAF